MIGLTCSGSSFSSLLDDMTPVFFSPLKEHGPFFFSLFLFVFPPLFDGASPSPFRPNFSSSSSFSYLYFLGPFSSFLTGSLFCPSWRRSLDLDYHSDAFERSPSPSFSHIPAKPAQLLFPLSHLSAITLHDLGPVATCMTSFVFTPDDPELRNLPTKKYSIRCSLLVCIVYVVFEVYDDVVSSHIVSGGLMGTVPQSVLFSGVYLLRDYLPQSFPNN